MPLADLAKHTSGLVAQLALRKAPALRLGHTHEEIVALVLHVEPEFHHVASPENLCGGRTGQGTRPHELMMVCDLVLG